jgi:hypothetical protein
MGNPSLEAVVMLWFEAELVVHCEPQLLFTPEIAFRRFNRDMPEQELDLFEFATGEMTKSGACAPQVVRSQLLNACRVRSLFHDCPDHFRGHAVSPDLAGLIDRPKDPAVSDSAD